MSGMKVCLAPGGGRVSGSHQHPTFRGGRTVAPISISILPSGVGGQWLPSVSYLQGWEDSGSHQYPTFRGGRTVAPISISIPSLMTCTLGNLAQVDHMSYSLVRGPRSNNVLDFEHSKDPRRLQD